MRVGCINQRYIPKLNVAEKANSGSLRFWRGHEPLSQANLMPIFYSTGD